MSKSLKKILPILGLALLVSGAASATMFETAATKGKPVVTAGEESCAPGVKTSDLMAGQNIDAGDVLIEILDGNLCVTYATTGDWELDEYHLWIGEYAQDYPQTRNGNPKLGHFPYTETGLTGGETPVTSETVCISPEELFESEWCDLGEVFIVAHAVVARDGDGDGYLDTSETGYAAGYELDGKSWATGTSADLCYEETFDASGLDNELVELVGDDGLVGLRVDHQSGNANEPYFRGQIDYDFIQNGTFEPELGLTGLPFYCVDLENTISSNRDYCALMVSSYNPNVGNLAGIINEQNLDLANYVLNNYEIGAVLDSGDAVTGGDIQRTLWALVFGPLDPVNNPDDLLVPVGAFSSGESSDANVNAMLAAALLAGEGYEPPCNGSVAVILYPVDCATGGPDIAAQALIAQALVTEFDSACSTVCTVCCN